MKPFLFFSFIILSTFVAQAQPGRGERREMIEERIDARRVAFLTDELQLTPTEAQGFWPIYNQYRDQLEELRKSRKGDKDIDGMNEQEAKAAIDNYFDGETRELALRRELATKLLTVIPARKVAKLHRAEQEFKMNLLREVQDRRGGGQGGPPPPPPGGRPRN